MNAINSRFFAVLLAALPAACFATDTPTGQQPGAKFAARMEGLLASMKHTLYQHTTAIDEEHGSVKCDCSGLVGFLLRHEFPEAYLSVRGEESPWRKRPLAVTYYETFVSAGPNAPPSGPWRQISSLMDVVPGDILAWRKKTIVRGSSTGHTCMVAGLPKMQADGTVRIRLIDSTSSPHSDDTRPTGTTGFGAGFKTFLVSNDGQPIGYFVGKRRVKVAIAVGRMTSQTSTTTQPPATESPDAGFAGMEISAAYELAKTRNQDVRVIRLQGKTQPVGWKIRDDRFNFIVEDNTVIQAIRG